MRYIVEDIGEVVSAMTVPATAAAAGVTAINYLYGHRRSIANRLLTKNVSGTLKYPLIALRLDTPEEIVDGFQQFDLNLIICTLTKKAIREEERQSEIFRPILYPLYEEFMLRLKKSGLFQWEGDQKYPPHTKVDRFFYGTPGAEANEKYIFSDALDGIEIINLKINSTNKC